MKIDDTLITKLESLSKLKLEEDEKISMKEDIENMISLFNQISDFDTQGVSPLRHMTDAINIMREDIFENQLNREQALKNAPSRIGHYFAVPKVIE